MAQDPLGTYVNPFSLKTKKPNVPTSTPLWKPNVFTEAGAGLARGTEGLVGSVGQMANWYGEMLNDPALAEWGKLHNEYWQQQANTGWEAPRRGMTLKQHPFIRSAGLLGEALPSVGLGFAGGIGAFKGAQAMGLIDKGAKWASLSKMAQLGISLAGTQPLGAVIGADMYQEARKNGLSKSTASKYAMLDWVGQSILEVVPLMEYMKGGTNLARRFLKVGFQEGMEEVTQGVFEGALKAYGWKGTEHLYQDITDGLLEQFIGGFLAGGLLGATASPDTIDNISGDLYRKLSRDKVFYKDGKKIPYKDVEHAVTHVADKIGGTAKRIAEIAADYLKNTGKIKNEMLSRVDQLQINESTIDIDPTTEKMEPYTQKRKMGTSKYDTLSQPQQEAIRKKVDDVLHSKVFTLADGKSMSVDELDMVSKQEFLEQAANGELTSEDVQKAFARNEIRIVGGESTLTEAEDASGHTAVLYYPRLLKGLNPIIPVDMLARDLSQEPGKLADLKVVGAGLWPQNIAQRLINTMADTTFPKTVSATDFIPQEGGERNDVALKSLGYSDAVAKAIDDVIEMIRTETGPAFLRSFKEIGVVFRQAGGMDLIEFLGYWTHDSKNYINIYADAIEAWREAGNEADKPLPYVIAQYMMHEYVHYLLRIDQKAMMTSIIKDKKIAQVAYNIEEAWGTLLSDMNFPEVDSLLGYKGTRDLFGLLEEVVAQAISNKFMYKMPDLQAIKTGHEKARFTGAGGAVVTIDGWLEAYNGSHPNNKLTKENVSSILQIIYADTMLKAQQRIADAKSTELQEKLLGIGKWSATRQNPIRTSQRNAGIYFRDSRIVGPTKGPEANRQAYIDSLKEELAKTIRPSDRAKLQRKIREASIKQYEIKFAEVSPTGGLTKDKTRDVEYDKTIAAKDRVFTPEVFGNYKLIPERSQKMDLLIDKARNGDVKAAEQLYQEFTDDERAAKLGEIEEQLDILDTQVPSDEQKEASKIVNKKSLKDIEFVEDKFNTKEWEEKKRRASAIHALNQQVAYERSVMDRMTEEQYAELEDLIASGMLTRKQAFILADDKLTEMDMDKDMTPSERYKAEEFENKEMANIAGATSSTTEKKAQDVGARKKSDIEAEIDGISMDLSNIERWLVTLFNHQYLKKSKSDTRDALKDYVADFGGQAGSVEKFIKMDAKFSRIKKYLYNLYKSGVAYVADKSQIIRVPAVGVDKAQAIEAEVNYLLEQVRLAKQYLDAKYRYPGRRVLYNTNMELKEGQTLFDENSQSDIYIPPGRYRIDKTGNYTRILITKPNVPMEQVVNRALTPEEEQVKIALKDNETGALWSVLPMKEILVDNTWFLGLAQDRNVSFNSTHYEEDRNAKFALWTGEKITPALMEKLDSMVSGRKKDTIGDKLSKDIRPQMREHGIALRMLIAVRKKINPLLTDDDIVKEVQKNTKLYNKMAPYKTFITQDQVSTIVQAYMKERHLSGLAGVDGSMISNSIMREVWKYTQNVYGTDDRETQQIKMDALLTLMHLANQEIMTVKGTLNYRLSDIGMAHRWVDGQIKTADGSKAKWKNSERHANLKILTWAMDALGTPLTAAELNSLRRERSTALFWSRLPKKLQDIVLVTKKEIEDPIFEELLESGLLDRTDNEANARQGFSHKMWVHLDEEHKSTRTKTYQITKGIQRHKYRTVAESILATSTDEQYGAGLKAITNYAAIMGDYVNDSLQKVNQDDFIKKLQGMMPVDNVGLPSIKDKSGQIHKLAYLIYEDDYVVVKNGKNRATNFMESLGYRQLKNAEGLIKRKGGAFLDPWVHPDVYKLLRNLYETKQQSQVMKSLLTINGIVKRNIMLSPYNFAVQIASSPMVWLGWKGAWNYGIKPLFWKGGLVPAGMMEYQKQQSDPDVWAHMKDAAYDDKLVALFIRHGARNFNTAWVNQTFFDYELLNKHPAQFSELERTQDMLGNKGGVDNYVFNQYVGRIMYQFMATMTSRFYSTLGNIQDPEVRKDEAARMAVAFANDTSGMIDKYIYGAEGPYLQAAMFARDFTMSFLRQCTAAAYPLWKQHHKYRVNDLKEVNSLLHGDKSSHDMEYMTKYYQAHLFKVVFIKLMLFSLLQFGLSFWDDDEDDKEQGIYAKKRWMFKNEPGKLGMIRMPKVGIFRSKGDEPLYLDPLLWREMSQMITLIESGPEKYMLGKMAWAPKTAVELISNTNYRGDSITNATGAITWHEKTIDRIKHVGSSSLPTFVRDTGRVPTWGKVASAIGVPLKSGTNAKDPWELLRMRRAVAQGQYWTDKKREKVYSATPDQLRKMMFSTDPHARITREEFKNEMLRRKMPDKYYKIKNKAALRKNLFINR